MVEIWTPIHTGQGPRWYRACRGRTRRPRASSGPSCQGRVTRLLERHLVAGERLAADIEQGQVDDVDHLRQDIDLALELIRYLPAVRGLSLGASTVQDEEYRHKSDGDRVAYGPKEPDFDLLSHR